MTHLPLGAGLTIPHRYLTRHVGIFGATGTGKTTTLGAIAERAPCPVLILDAKGDLESLGATLTRPQMRIHAMGADLISRALDLSEPQAGALHIALAWAADNGRAVATLSDLRALLNDTLAADLSADYGLVSKLSVSAIQRALLRLERGAPWAFGTGVRDPRDTAGITVYAASDLTHLPGLYGAFVAHVLDSLYRGLGELGDVAAPGLLVLIDEAHLVFDGAPAAIVRRIEQITRLIRSKGVGLIYVTQAPSDLPAIISAQLATRIQHGLRAATMQHHQALKAAAETMPGTVTAADILGLGTGQAWVSVPDGSGKPLPARRVMIQRGSKSLHSVGLPPPEVATPRAWVQEGYIPPEEPPAPPRGRHKPWPWYFWPGVLALILYGWVMLGG